MDLTSAFAQHVLDGLSAPQAFLSSRFIYDEKGSKLFQKIMALEEYYLTRSEFEILSTNKADFGKLFSDTASKSFDLVEFGAGDGTKTKILLQHFLDQKLNFTYRPVDISISINEELKSDLTQRFPSLEVIPITASYQEALSTLKSDSVRRRVLLFMGSNIGNFKFEDSKAFCLQIANSMSSGDLFVLGVDLRKNPRTILAAYDDNKNVTARFNLNLLHRMKRELGASLDTEGWGFYPLYNPETGEVRSYLYPIDEQTISIPALEFQRTFLPGETIHTEVSRKYSQAELAQLAQYSGLHPVQSFTDEKLYFVNTVWRKP